MAEPNFWNDQQHAQKLIFESNSLKEQINTFKEMYETHENLTMTFELLQEEHDDELESELIKELLSLKEILEKYELEQLLSEEHDRHNAILEIHPGAGGTESQDWAQMLLRMYTRWADKNGFKIQTLNYLAGDDYGIKSVTISVKGPNAYGYLKSEKGVHRLVRISPFDNSGRRHTSFASCDVVPELDDSVEVVIRTEDLKIDTYRASGAGGQHINTTDSAVRITHLPTGVVVTCQSERSQIKNRDQAMKMLKSKLHLQKTEEQARELAEIRGEQTDIGWGSQIRSYVFMPYQLVKDHRTNAETSNVNAVLDGDIDLFINNFLRFKMK